MKEVLAMTYEVGGIREATKRFVDEFKKETGAPFRGINSHEPTVEDNDHMYSYWDLGLPNGAYRLTYYWNSSSYVLFKEVK